MANHFQNPLSSLRHSKLSDFEVLKICWEQLKVLNPNSREYQNFLALYEEKKKTVIIDGGKV